MSAGLPPSHSDTDLQKCVSQFCSNEYPIYNQTYFSGLQKFQVRQLCRNQIIWLSLWKWWDPEISCGEGEQRGTPIQSLNGTMTNSPGNHVSGTWIQLLHPYPNGGMLLSVIDYLSLTELSTVKQIGWCKGKTKAHTCFLKSITICAKMSLIFLDLSKLKNLFLFTAKVCSIYFMYTTWYDFPIAVIIAGNDMPWHHS